MILITGGTGLVGAHLILECLIKNLKIRAIYRSQEKLNEIELFFDKYASKKDKNHFQRIEWIKTNLNDIMNREFANTLFFFALDLKRLERWVWLDRLLFLTLAR